MIDYSRLANSEICGYGLARINCVDVVDRAHAHRCCVSCAAPRDGEFVTWSDQARDITDMMNVFSVKIQT